MKKKASRVLYAMFLSLCFVLAVSSARSVYAAEETQDVYEEDGETAETETETELPESYFLPIESNETKGWPKGPQVEAEAAVVMDADTGAFLYSKNMMAKEYPASITKIMTALVAIENGKLDSKIKCSEHAVYSIETGSSHCGLQPGEKITLRQALYALMLESANDAANSIAEKVGGSIENFVQMMNDRAKELGCVNTHFSNTHGLHQEDHYTCAYDMALITRAAFENETLAEIAGTVEYTIPKTNKVKETRYFVNHHKMLTDSSYHYDGCIGGKTGFTSDALNTLVTVSQKDERKLISVVLRTNGADKTYQESAALLDYGYQEFTHRSITPSGTSVTLAKLTGMNYLGKAGMLESAGIKEPIVQTGEQVRVSLPKGVKKGKVKAAYSPEGMIRYTLNGWEVGSIGIRFLPVTARGVSVSTESRVSQAAVVKEEEQKETGDPEETGKETETGEGVVQTVRRMWSETMDWIYSHDVAAAIVVLLVIIALLPILVIAYVRNRSSQIIRKERRREREERIRREEEIDSKSVQEIEEEIRAELERERRKKEREEAREREKLREEQAMAEAEKIIDEYRRDHPQEPGETKGEDSV